MRRYVQALGPALAILAADQWSKAWAVHHLQGAPARSLVPGLVELRFTTNRGALFGHSVGMESWALRLVLIAIGLGAAAWLSRLLVAGFAKTSSRVSWAYRLALSGVLGNTLDRLFSHRVTDFLHLRLGEWLEVGTINLADVAVIAGVVLLIPELLRRQNPTLLSSRPNLPSR